MAVMDEITNFLMDNNNDDDAAASDETTLQDDKKMFRPLLLACKQLALPFLRYHNCWFHVSCNIWVTLIQQICRRL